MSDEKPAAGGGAKKMIILGIGALALVGAAVGGTLALTGGKSGGGAEHATTAEGEGHGEEGAPIAASVYIDLAPEFVVNFRDKNNRSKFLKAELSVSTKDPAVEEEVKRHMPAIRNSLILLLSRQIYDDLMPNEGKEALRAEALAAVQGVLQAQTGKPGVDDLYFGTFVMH